MYNIMEKTGKLSVYRSIIIRKTLEMIVRMAHAMEIMSERSDNNLKALRGDLVKVMQWDCA